MDQEPAPIHQTIDACHRFLRGELPGGLDELLHDDVVFYSPIVYTPQEGKAITKLYLEAAGQTLPGDPAPEAGGSGLADGSGVGGGFRYTKKVLDGHTAVLEFETTVSGKYVNGVDIITCDDEGKIVEFKVMLRPLQAINAVHEAMRAMLERGYVVLPGGVRGDQLTFTPPAVLTDAQRAHCRETLRAVLREVR